MPCSQGVDIPTNFAVYNEGLMYNKEDSARGQYGWWKYAHEVQGIYDHDIRAVVCIQCQECEAKCPQSIPISEWMSIVHQVLGEGQPYGERPLG